MSQVKSSECLSNIKLLFAIGNPGNVYTDTRHNIGIFILRHIAKILESDFYYNKKVNSYITKYQKEDGDKIIIAISNEYMNNSGTSLLKLMKYYKILSNDVLILQDEMKLDFLETTVNFKGSSHGHNGIKNIVEKLGTNQFYRLKIGIGKPKKKTGNVSYVLSRFSKAEKKRIYENLNSILRNFNKYKIFGSVGE